VVLANSPHITGVRDYSRSLPDRAQIFGYRTLTLYGPAFTPVRLTCTFITVPPTVRSVKGKPHDPVTKTPDRYHVATV
jgi:hypothetical protein